jgi:hypothetical protein
MSEAQETTLLGRLLKLTGRFTSSLLSQVAAYAAALTAAVYAFQKLNQPLGQLQPWLRMLIISTPIIFAVAFGTIPTLVDEHRKSLLKRMAVDGTYKKGYFSLAPRNKDEESSFIRADQTHLDVLRWLQQNTGSILYLTGMSGSGKSSLLQAWVRPQLERQRTRVISVRGYQNPTIALQQELIKPGAVWSEPPQGALQLMPLLVLAANHINPSTLFIIFDQFEEALILQDPEQLLQISQLLASLCAQPIANLKLLLVFRSDYAGLIAQLNLPLLRQGDNWKEVPPFTERDARHFLLDSGLRVHEELLQGVLREAAELDQTKGLIRPITINLCGLVLSRFASGVDRKFRPGSLVRGFLQESVNLPSVRNVAPRILPKLISSSVTKVPRTIGWLAQKCGFDSTVVHGCMLVLGQADRAIVRPIDSRQQTWEISHDFLVPLLDSIVSRKSVSAWRLSRPYLPWLAAAILVIAFRATPKPVLSGPRFGVMSPEHQSDTASYARIEPVMEPVPVPRGGLEPVLKLSDVYGAEGEKVTQAILRQGKIVFQAAGSTGHIDSTGEDQHSTSPSPTVRVAERMEDQFRHSGTEPKPSFLFLLGDEIFSFGESQYYYSEFYLPFVEYPAPILAIAGNHDGMVVPGTSTPSLQAFLENFCARDFHQTPASGGIGRTAQIQPGPYFTFEAPFVRIIALYSNVLENPGVISSGGNSSSPVSDTQLRFLEAAFNRIKSDKFEGAVIVVVHHNPYSYGSAHPSSLRMLADLDTASRRTGVWPHAVLSGHAINYQRFTRVVDGMEIPYLVSGNGGHGVSKLNVGDSGSVRTPLKISDNLTFESYDDSDYGFLSLTVDRQHLQINYYDVPEGMLKGTRAPKSADDSVVIDLKSRHIEPMAAQAVFDTTGN